MEPGPNLAPLYAKHVEGCCLVCGNTLPPKPKGQRGRPKAALCGDPECRARWLKLYGADRWLRDLEEGRGDARMSKRDKRRAR